MKEAAAVILAVQKARGNDKIALLQHYANVSGLKEILRFIYNPYCKTGIGVAKVRSEAIPAAPAKHITWAEAIKYFSEHQTGNNADVSFARDFIACHVAQRTSWLAAAIVTQDLKMGVSVTTLNKVFGDSFIPKTGCMLGTPFSDVKRAKIMWPCIVTEKLDGIRRILIKEGGVCRFYSRSGHEDTGLIEIAKEAKWLPDNFVYDGELLAKGTFKDCIAQRQATNSIANSKGAKTGLTFNVFDMVPVDEYYAGCSCQAAIIRKARLAATLGDESVQYLLKDNWAQFLTAFNIYEDLQFIKPVPILGMVSDLSEAEPIVSEIWRRGGEGIMLNTAGGLYEIKRSKSLLKVKHTEEHVLPIVNVMEGSGKYEDSCGAIVVLYTDKQGQKWYVKVGSGFTDDQRADIWCNQDKYIGRYAEIETFGESTNAAGQRSLNCPIFKRMVGDE